MQYIFKQTQVRVFSHSPDKLGHLYKLLMDKFHYWKLKQALQDKLNRFSGDHGNPVNIIKCVKTQVKQRSPLNIHSHDTQVTVQWSMTNEMVSVNLFSLISIPKLTTPKSSHTMTFSNKLSISFNQTNNHAQGISSRKGALKPWYGCWKLLAKEL